MHGREAQVSVLEGKQEEGERDRADMFKNCFRTSLIGIKDFKDYKK